MHTHTYTHIHTHTHTYTYTYTHTYTYTYIHTYTHIYGKPETKIRSPHSNAGAWSVGVLTGVCDAETLGGAGADAVVGSAAHVTDLLDTSLCADNSTQ